MRAHHEQPGHRRDHRRRRGINVERVKAKAVERGLITTGQADAMSDREAWHLIFLPGFSTAAQVTNVSGRGVGMDVVKTNVEKIGGTVEVVSELGQGTTLRVRIPLTLAIVPALLVNCGGDRYAIPQREVLELVRVDGEKARTAVELLHDAPVYRLRGNLLPLVNLREVMALPGRDENDALTIAVLSADGQQFGLVVDGVVATEEIVVKPLGRMLRSVPIFSGATIMGDGRVALILDVAGIARVSSSVSSARTESDGGGARERSADIVDRVPLLIVATGEDTRVAIPLADVARLEEIPVDTIEQTRGREVVQYRGEIMPLVRVSELVGTYGDSPVGEHVTAVVHAYKGRQVGIVVDRIVDIVDTELPQHRDSVTTTLVVADRVTELLDVTQAMAGVVGSLFDDLVEV
ncbi:MAG: chemotaxis protein CheW [Ilumatobacteraceae bacterium]